MAPTHSIHLKKEKKNCRYDFTVNLLDSILKISAIQLPFQVTTALTKLFLTTCGSHFSIFVLNDL